MNNEIMELKGINGILVLDVTSLTFNRKGTPWSSPLKGDKTIPYTSIIAVQFKPARFITSGFLQLTLKGGREAAAGTLNAMVDENTIAFKGKDNNQKFLDAKQFIEDKMSQASNSQYSSLDELEKLAALKDKGIISEEEFNIKKKQLLGI